MSPEEKSEVLEDFCHHRDEQLSDTTEKKKQGFYPLSTGSKGRGRSWREGNSLLEWVVKSSRGPGRKSLL